MMKTYSFLFVLFLGVAYFQEAHSQVVVIKDNEMTFSDGTDIYHSIRSKSVTLPSGFILKTATFQLPLDHPAVPAKGTRLIGMRFILSYVTDSSGEFVLDDDGNKIPFEFITDEKVDINHKGRFNVTMHLNAAGHFLPLGWYDPSYYE